MEQKTANQKQIEIENKWQKFWKENKTFEPKINESQEKFFGNVAYPYANSVMHIGHGRTYTIADIYLRYQRLIGKNVLQPLGYHISGTPVLAVADGIKREDPKILKQVKDAVSDYAKTSEEQDKLIETFKSPSDIANYFSGTIEGALDSMGISIDWSRQFTTGEPLYNKFIEWQYSKLKENGLLKQGKYPILYSAQDENAVGEDDIKDGDIEKVSVSQMVAIKFKIINTNEYIICATLRPDALFCATNLWVKSDMQLVKLYVNKEVWIVSKKAQIKIEHQFDNVEFIEELEGRDLLDEKVTAPIINKELPIYPADFCDENHGTGLVYSSPADSPHDYLNLFQAMYPNKSLDEFKDEEPLKLTPITETFNKKGKKIEYKFNIPAYDILMKKGIFKEKGNEEKLEEAKQELYKEAHFGAKMINAGEFTGLPLKNNIGADKVKEKLFENNQAINFFETSRRAKTRNNDDVIVANLQGQWFLDYSDRKVKDKALDLLEKSNFFPHNLKQTEVGYIEWANMRPCARKRGLGTQIPYDKDWIIEPLSDSTIYQMLYMIMHLIRKYEVKPEELNFKFFDYVYLDSVSLEKVLEDNSINKEFVKQAKKEIKYWNNVDFRYVGMPHMSNHLNFLIYHYSLIFPKTMWPSMIVAGNLLMREGEKISKSKGNGIPLYRMKTLYGSDLTRLYFATNSNYDIEMDFKDNEIFGLDKKFNKWQSLIQGSISKPTKAYEEFSNTNKWLISKFYSRVEEYFKFFNEFRIREAFVTILYEFLNDVNYHERRTSEEETLEVIKFISHDYVKLMTPAVPHIAEELNELIGIDKTPVSLQSFTTDTKKYVNKEAEKEEGIIEEIVAKIYKAKDSKQLENVSKIQIITPTDLKYELFEFMNNLLNETRDFKTIFNSIREDGRFGSEMKFVQKFLPKTINEGLTTYLTKKEENNLLNSVKKFIEKEFNSKVEFISAQNLEKAPQAIPGEPAIVLE